MRLWRHLLAMAGAAAPILLVGVWVSSASGTAATVALVIAWVATVAGLAALTWVRWGRHMAAIEQRLGADGAARARVELRRMQENLSRCRGERGAMASLLDDVSEGLGEGLLVVDSDLRVRLMNPISRRFCGRDRAPVGTLLLELVRDPDVVGVVGRAAEGQRPDHIVVENERGLWEVRAFPLEGGGAVVLLADVGLLRRSEELRRQFVQDLSHELRSPLAVIRTTVEALESDMDPQGGQILLRQVERLTRLTGELQELASIEAGEVQLELEPVHLRTLAAEVLADLGSQAEAAAVRTRLEVPHDLVLTADRRALGRVLTNLVDNAIKCNRRGGWVEVRARADGQTVVLEVEDNGVGIPADQVRAVFQRFYRLDRARTPGQGGLGLGLAIVKHLVQRMGGSVSLASRETVGTTVTVRLG